MMGFLLLERLLVMIFFIGRGLLFLWVDLDLIIGFAFRFLKLDLTWDDIIYC
jgi:hypothetical protein